MQRHHLYLMFRFYSCRWAPVSVEQAAAPTHKTLCVFVVLTVLIGIIHARFYSTGNFMEKSPLLYVRMKNKYRIKNNANLFYLCKEQQINKRFMISVC